MKVVIIGSGNITDYPRISGAVQESAASFIICCDGGANHARKLGITPDVILGDLDSIEAETLEYFKREGVRFEKHPCEKDFTDMEIGLKKAFEIGADEILFLGATGDRTDHTLANIGLLYECLKVEISAVLLDDNNKVWLTDKKTELSEKIGSTVSLLPLTEEVSGITTTGLQYPLKNESLKWGMARGVSNVVVRENASIDLKSGILIIIVPYRS